MRHRLPKAAPAAAKHVTDPADVQKLLGPAPLFIGEDQAAYNELLTRVQAFVRPKDIIEEFWVRDIIDNTWEVLRLRRVKAALWNELAREGASHIMAPLLGSEESKVLIPSKPRTLSKKAAPGGGRGSTRRQSRQAHNAVVRGRGPLRPKRPRLPSLVDPWPAPAWLV